VPNVDVPACMRFPKQHWATRHSTHPIKRLNGQIKRRTDVVGIVPNDGVIGWAFDPLIRLPAAS